MNWLRASSAGTERYVIAMVDSCEYPQLTLSFLAVRSEFGRVCLEHYGVCNLCSVALALAALVEYCLDEFVQCLRAPRRFGLVDFERGFSPILH